MTNKYDIVIVGAGISGISTAYWLQKKCPNKTICIIEGRKSIGGTWSLFKYPGIRSDSDMFTFGYRFKPWSHPKTLSKGEDILNYIKETAEENDLTKYIKFNHRMSSADWSDENQEWTIQINTQGDKKQIKSTFLSICSGYYDYNNAHRPSFEGEENYKGNILIPQFWPENVEYKDKKFIVVGSGATAVTLVPSLAKKGAKVTMLQRSPTYIMKLPNRNGLYQILKKILPLKTAYKIVRTQNILLQVLSYNLAQYFPKYVKKIILKEAANQLPKGYPVNEHFNPNYNPWDQRLCVVPDGDLFTSIREGNASVVTDHISHFTEEGIMTKKGDQIKAENIVLATGLKIQLVGGATLSTNGNIVKINERMMYKGMLISDVPNLIYAFGYTNASWTLKVDLTANYLCKLINHLDKIGKKSFCPIAGQNMTEKDFLQINSGYIKRAKNTLPKQGNKLPWKVIENYIVDMVSTRYGSLKDKYLKFN